MSYQKADALLPIELVEIIQKYIDGAYIYIPRKEDNKKSWGSGTKTKQELAVRNEEIFNEYLAGASVNALAEKYYLSSKSIHRIVAEQK